MPIDPISSQLGSSTIVTSALKSAGKATGVSFDFLLQMAKRESSLDPNAKAKTSSAAGLFQFIDQTWLGAVKNHGARHGLSEFAADITKNANGKYTVADPARRQEILDLRYSADTAAALAGELANDNKAALERKLGRGVSNSELYAAHFLGATGAATILKADAGASAAQLLPKAAAANKPVFYDGARERSVAEVMTSIAKSMGEAASERKGLAGGGDVNAAPFIATRPSTPPLAPMATRLREGLTLAALTETSVDKSMRAAGSTFDPSRWRGLESGGPAMGPLSDTAWRALYALDPTVLTSNERGERKL